MFRRISGLHLWVARTCAWIGIICLILGIISGAVDNELGLGATNWLLLTLAFGVGGILNMLLGFEESIKE